MLRSIVTIVLQQIRQSNNTDIIEHGGPWMERVNTGVIQSLHECDITIATRPKMPWPDQVMMVEPEFFDVEYVINPHMESMIGCVDKNQAWLEWSGVKAQFEEWGLYVHPLKGMEGLPDLVFCANQSFPLWEEEAGASFLMGAMRSPMRRSEVPYLHQVLAHKGYPVHSIFPVNQRNEEDQKTISQQTVNAANKMVETDKTPLFFEGMGDVQWHPERSLIWAGHGFRTSMPALEALAAFTRVPVISLRLQDERLYHLDTCFCMLDEQTVMIYPRAFDEVGLELIHHFFDVVLEIDERETLESFTCNATAIAGRRVLLPSGSPKTARLLESNGFTVAELPTYEFLKSGGSIYCMKMLFWSQDACL